MKVLWFNAMGQLLYDVSRIPSTSAILTTSRALVKFEHSSWQVTFQLCGNKVKLQWRWRATRSDADGGWKQTHPRRFRDERRPLDSFTASSYRRTMRDGRRVGLDNHRERRWRGALAQECDNYKIVLLRKPRTSLWGRSLQHVKVVLLNHLEEAHKQGRI